MPLEDPVPYGPQPYGGYYQEQPAEGALDQAKKWLPLLVGLLLVAGVAYFAYDYFVGSIQKVSFSVKNSENESLNNATVRVSAPGQKTPLATFTGAGTIELRRGTYEYEAAASGYKPAKAMPFAVSQETSTIPIELSKNINVDLEAELPASMVMGQRVEAKVKLKNNRPAPETIELVFDGVLGGDVMDISYEPITLGGNSSDEIKLTLTVKEGVDKAKLGKDKKGGIRVKYTRTKKDLLMSILEFDPQRVSVSVSRLDFGKVNAGNTAEKEIKITNNNKDFDLKDVQFTLEDVRTQNNLADEVRSWFSFIPDKIPSISYGSKSAESVSLRVETPANASDDKVNARVVISTDYWQKSLNVELDIKGKEVALVMDGLSDKFTISKDATTGKYKTETDTIELVNKGEVDVEQVNVVVDTVKCDSSWVTLEGIKDFDSIAPQERKKDTRMLITAPANIPKDFIQTCLLLVRYSDPFSPLDRQVIQKTFEIHTE